MSEEVPEGRVALSVTVSPTAMFRLVFERVTFEGALTTFTVSLTFRPLWVLTVIFAVPLRFAVTMR